MSMPTVGWAEGICPKCGRVWRRKHPANTAICDCHGICPICGKEMIAYIPNIDPRTHRNEDIDDPTGLAEKHEATIRTRYRCPDCDYYGDGEPVEVELR